MRNRPCRDDYHMVQALWIRVRSQDESTQHGCIVIAEDGKPLSQGYNGFPKDCDDEKMPQTRPDKYYIVLHSEENAILNCDVSMKGATAYITGPPCAHCWSQLIQKDIARVVFGPVRSTHKDSQHLEDSELQNRLIDLLLEGRDIDVVEWIPEDVDLLWDELDELKQLIQLSHMRRRGITRR